MPPACSNGQKDTTDPGEQIDEAYSLVTDRKGNVFVTGLNYKAPAIAVTITLL